MRFGGVAVLLLFPQSVFGAVLINEIAWNGYRGDANDEWVELYNSGESSVDLSGWTMFESGEVLASLSGEIGPGEYAVLERTDDTSAPGAAFLVYTGALNNSGQTLTLARSSNVSDKEDEVAGGDGWEHVGGELSENETAQRTSAGWVAAPGTPGEANEEEAVSSDDAVEEENVSPSRSGNSPEPDPVGSLRIVAPEVVFVHEAVSFSVVPDGGTKGRLIRYRWNFGDAETADRRDVVHAYRSPGTYVVMVESRYLKEEETARHRIVVLPHALTLARSASGDVYIHNDARREIRLAGYTLQGVEEFVFPEHTVLLADATVTIPASYVENGRRGVVALYDPEGEMVAYWSPYKKKETKAVVRERESVEVQEDDEEVVVASSSPTASVVAAEDDAARPGNILGLMGLLAVGAAGMFARRKT